MNLIWVLFDLTENGGKLIVLGSKLRLSPIKLHYFEKKSKF